MHRKINSVSLSLKPKLPEVYKTSLFPGLGRITPDSNPYSSHNDITPIKSDKGSKFFVANSNSVSKSTVIKSSDTVPILPFWEIHERVDSFNLRTSEKLNAYTTPDKILAEYSQWGKIVAEITKIISLSSEEFGDIIHTLQSQNKRLFKILFSSCNAIQEQNTKDQNSMKSSINKLNTQVNTLVERIKENERLQGITQEQISKEIKEIFGTDTLDVNSIRDRIEKLKNYDRIPAADVLKDVLDFLSKQQYIPDYKPQAFSGIDIQEYQKILEGRFKSIQSNTAHKLAKYFEQKQLSSNEYTQTTELYIHPDAHKQAKDALEKVKLQFQSLSMQYETLKALSTGNELKLNVVTEENSKLSADNLAMSINIQNFIEKEKLLKNKIQKMRDEIVQIHSNAPYLNNTSRGSAKPMSPDQKNNNLRSLSRGYSKNVEESKIILVNPQENEIDDKKTEDFQDINLISPGTIENNTSHEEIGINKNLLETNNLVNYPIKESLKPGDIYNDYQSFSHSEDNQSISRSLLSSSKDIDYPVKNFEDRKETFDLLENHFYSDDEDFDSNIIPEDIEIKPQNHKIDNKKNKNLENTQKIEKKVSFENPTKKNILNPKPLEKPKKLIKDKNKIDKSTSNNKNTSPINNTNFTKDFNKNTVPIKQTPINVLQKALDVKDKIELVLPDASTKNKPIDDKYTKSDIKPSASKNFSKIFNNPTIPSAEALKKTEKLIELLESTSPKPYKPVSPKKPVQKDLKKNENLKQAKELPETQSPSLNQDKIALSSNQINEKSIPKANKSVWTDSDLPKLNYKDFSSQFGPELPSDSKQSGIYFMPFNPNNLYGLKGDKYYHTSKSVFSAQPLIPELSSSYVFSPPFHLSNN